MPFFLFLKEKQSTVLSVLHIPQFLNITLIKWLGMNESNIHKRNQNPWLYHLTNPQQNWYPREVTLLRLTLIKRLLYFLTKGAWSLCVESNHNHRLRRPVYYPLYYRQRLYFICCLRLNAIPA